jgi:hypothetical protein
MEPTLLVAALLAIVAALLLFAAMTLLGVWVVRAMRLPLDLPAELRLAPAPPAFADHRSIEEAHAIAGRQARLAVIHRQALEAAVLAEQCVEMAGQRQGRADAKPIHAAALRARSAAEAADQSRGLADEAEAATATARQLELAQAAWQEACAAFGTPKPPVLRYVVLGMLTVLVAAGWVVLLMMRHAAASPS